MKMLDLVRERDHATHIMKINITPELKAALELRHSKVHDGRERDRIKAVLLRSEGWTIVMIAQALRIDESTITRHLKDFANNQKLNPENGGSQSYLNTAQTEQLIVHLTEITYHHTYQICAYIEKNFDIKYSVPGLNKWLHNNGFSYKQPKGVPHKFDAEKQDAFIAKYEPLKEALTDDDVLLFMDAVHPTQATKVTSGWIRTGIDKTIETTGSRTRLNIVGAIRLGYLSDAITEQYKTVNGESIIDFLEKVKRTYASKKTIQLVLDGAGYHRSQLVIDKAKELNITLHYLPPYSPNLNPIERLWKVMSEYARNNRYFATAKEFRRHINHFFDVTLPAIGTTLDGRINDNFQKFYPAS
jgi:transposase